MMKGTNLGLKPPMNCTYSELNRLKIPIEEKCQQIAKGICKEKYSIINPYELYYCQLNESDTFFIISSSLALVLLYISSNYIRRRYFSPPLLSLRRVLGVSGSMAELVIIPIASGMVSLSFRIQAVLLNSPLELHFCDSLGSILYLTCVNLGVASFLLKKSKILNPRKLVFDLIYSSIPCLLYTLVSLGKSISLFVGVFISGIWIFYLAWNLLIKFYKKKCKYF